MKLYAFLSLFLIVFLSGNVVCAAVPKLSKAGKPTWLRVSQKQAVLPDLGDISDGYYFEQVEYQVNLANQTRFFSSVKTIVENAGTENAGQINILFEPHYQTLILHELYIIRGGRQLDRLDLGKFQLMASETELSRSNIQWYLFGISPLGRSSEGRSGRDVLFTERVQPGIWWKIF